MMTIKRRISIVLAVCIFVTGVVLVVFPIVSKWIGDYEDSSMVDDFDDFISDSGNMYNIDLDRLYRDIKKYNEDLFIRGRDYLPDMYTFDKPHFDLRSYGAPDDTFGYIEAPAISLRLPIYLGASVENMKRGAGNLYQTSVPIGDKNTNAVLAAHTGMENKTMFDNIVKLNNNDDVYVTNFWSRLHYKVVKTQIVLPNASSVVDIEPDKDIVTLLTCYPYRKNTHRFVVVCERVD